MLQNNMNEPKRGQHSTEQLYLQISGGQTTAHGLHVTHQWILCGPRSHAKNVQEVTIQASVYHILQSSSTIVSNSIHYC